MPTVEQLRERLVDKLKELFQLNEPVLDFGFYRIMHAKTREVQNFLEKDLLAMVGEAFQDADEAVIGRLYDEWQKTLDDARDYGVENPERSLPVQRAKARLDAAKDTASAEAEVYDHLYRFFERYYDDGDFISLRYYARESGGRAAPYAIPYNGEEVKLHWANSDQYYIKTTEHFANFCVVLDNSAVDPVLPVDREQFLHLFDGRENEKEDKLRLHFRVREATEGEHGNIKTDRDKERFFRIAKKNPIEFTETGELVVYFTFEPDASKQGGTGRWQAQQNRQAEQAVLNALEKLAAKNLRAADYLARLKIIPDPGNSDKTMLGRYIHRYTGRNTKDYFIHKDLGAFLRRELDFYLKNEVMRLDDIENADAPAVESYLKKLQVMRRIAGKLITFLAQLEDFQKKLWLKKKFVVECNYCLTLDRVPEDLYPSIAANKEQWREWQTLYAFEQNACDEAFLRAHPYMMLDTRFYDADFTARLLAEIDNLDAFCDGVIVHSENFQALSLMQERYRKQIKCVYIDPPYNTDASPIIYKNGYKHSSWCTLLGDRIRMSLPFILENGIFCAAIDDFELNELNFILKDIFTNRLGTIAVRTNPSGRPSPGGFLNSHDYALFFSSSPITVTPFSRSDSQNKRYKHLDGNGRYMWELLRKRGSDSERQDSPKAYYPFYVSEQSIRVPKMLWQEDTKTWNILEKPAPAEQAVYPVDEQGVERRWRWGVDNAVKNCGELRAERRDGGGFQIYYKYYPPQGVQPTSMWIEAKYSAVEHGTGLLKQFFSEYDPFSFPKSLYLVEDCIRASGVRNSETVLDYFGGSGTTAHAVINLNREDNGNRKYVLVEMGDHCNNVLKPRIQKVVYSNSWKAGRPQDTNGVSHCFKYLRLESYEDTLNNLTLARTPEQDRALTASAGLREDYMLRYLLDVESKGSQSLLNVDGFADPRNYKLLVKKTAANEYVETTVDLVDTFNWLIGLRVERIGPPQYVTAEFVRERDPELPEGQETRLILKDGLKQAQAAIEPGEGAWWFRNVEGLLPSDRFTPNNGSLERALIIWRTRSGDLEKDNALLEAWFEEHRSTTQDRKFDVIYVNGSNTLPSLRRDDEHWKVVLIEEEFFKRMWETE